MHFGHPFRIPSRERERERENERERERERERETQCGKLPQHLLPCREI
jgi:hypothetical protein